MGGTRKMHNYYFVSYLLLSSCLVAAIDQHEQVFTAIYDTAVWGKNSEGQGFSGGGSLLENSKIYINYLENFIKTHDIKTIVDAGCGDWEFSKYVNWNDAFYVGYDVVASVIAKNIKNYSKENISFVHGNLLAEDLPKADLLLCKHVLQHLTNADILLFIQQLPKFKYCLITNEVYPETLSSDGSDTEIGGGHKIDLTLPPFNLVGIKVLNYHIESSVHQIFLIDNTAGFDER